MTKPLTISWLPSPLALLTNCARPTVPPAPGMLITCALLASFSAVSACCIERAVWSQPPPGAAGAMILSSIWANAGVASKVAPAISDAAAKASDRQRHERSSCELSSTPLRAAFAAASSARRRVRRNVWPQPAKPPLSRKACSSGVVARPSTALRCGKRPKRRMMSACSSRPFQQVGIAGRARTARSSAPGRRSVSECSNGR